MKTLKKSIITETIAAINADRNRDSGNQFGLSFPNEYAVCTELRKFASNLSAMAETDDLSPEQHLELFTILFNKKWGQNVTAITNLESKITEFFGKNALDLSYIPRKKINFL